MLKKNYLLCLNYKYNSLPNPSSTIINCWDKTKDKHKILNNNLKAMFTTRMYYYNDNSTFSFL